MTEDVFVIFQFQSIFYVLGPCVVLLSPTSLLVFVSSDFEFICCVFGLDLVLVKLDHVLFIPPYY